MGSGLKPQRMGFWKVGGGGGGGIEEAIPHT